MGMREKITFIFKEKNFFLFCGKPPENGWNMGVGREPV
jgi:hypothetical protein